MVVMPMTQAQAAALREPFDPTEVGKLPRVTCRDCSSRDSTCTKHQKVKCPICNAYISTAHIHLDFVGHAELTDRLLSVDPEWNWEPVAWIDGAPAITKQGTNLVMWGRLTLCGITRPGVGTAPAGKDDAHKELIGDFLRNAAMRFGVALDLWRKSERAESEHPEEQRPLAGWSSLEEQDEAHHDLKTEISEQSPDVQASMREIRKDRRFGWPMSVEEMAEMRAELDRLRGIEGAASDREAEGETERGVSAGPVGAAPSSDLAERAARLAGKTATPLDRKLEGAKG